MIAKALGAGGGWSGKVEYLYEGKLEERQATDKKAEVILHSANLRVPYGYSDKAGRQRMKVDFIAQARSHKWASKKAKTIGEHVLSFTPEDMRVLGTKNGMHQVAGEYVRLLGLDKTQHVAILHQDTDNPHLHIVFNRVTDEGKKYKDSHERRRALAAAVALSQKHGLSLVGDLKPASVDYRTKAMRAGMKDLQALRAERPILSEARNLRHLGKLAEKQALTIEDRGDSIILDKQPYKLSDLEAMFQANRDAAALAKAVQEKEAQKIGEKEKAISKAEQKAAPAPEPHPLMRDATSVADLEKTALHRGIRFGLEKEHVSLDGKEYPLAAVEAMMVENGQRAAKHQAPAEQKILHIKSTLPPTEVAALAGKDPLPQQKSEPQAEIVRDGYAELLENMRRDVPILQTATSVAEVVRMAIQQGIFYERDQEWGTTIGERTIHNRGIEEIVACNAAEQAAVQFPGQTEESPEVIARQMAEVEARLDTLLAELKVAEEGLAGHEAELAREQQEAQGQQPSAQSAPEGENTKEIQRSRLIPEETTQPKIPVGTPLVSVGETLEPQQTIDPSRPQPVPEKAGGWLTTIEEIHAARDPILQIARSQDELIELVMEQGGEFGRDEYRVRLNGVEYEPVMFDSILRENARRPVVQETVPAAQQEVTSFLPFLDQAISRWQLEELAQRAGIEYRQHPDQGVSLGEHTVSVQSLDARLEANRANYERQRYEEIRQSLGEIGQARSRAEMTHLAKAGEQDLTFGREIVLQDRQGQTRHYDAQDVDAVLSQNLKTSATPANALLDGKGADMTNLGHANIVAKKTGISLSVDEASITTVDRKGNVKTFDKKAVLVMLAVNQANKIANLRARFSFLKEVESFREFEELAQEKKQVYQAVQASDAAESLRSGQQAIEAGRVTIRKGIEKMEEAEEMVAFAEITGKQGQQLMRKGKTREGQLMTDLGRYSMVMGAKQAQEAEQAVIQGAEAIKVGADVVERVNLLGKEALENYLQSPGQIMPGQTPPEQAAKSEAVPPPTVSGELTWLLDRISNRKETVKEEETDYIISGRTRYVQLGNQQLHRSDLRQIIEENKIEREKKFDKVHQSQRLLRESTDFGDMHRRAERLEMKVETRGRWVEIQGQKGPTRVRKSDLDEMLFLNRTNHRGREHDHRHGQTVIATEEVEYRYAEKQNEALRKAGVEYNKDGTISFSKDSPEYQQQQKDREQVRGQDYVGRMVSHQTGNADRVDREYKPDLRQRSKGTRRGPDHEQKIGKLKLSTDKSKKMRL